MSDHIAIPDNLTGDDAEATIRRSLWNYPTLAKSRMDVIHHLMVVIGNGYEWEDGVLIEVGGEEEIADPNTELGSRYHNHFAESGNRNSLWNVKIRHRVDLRDHELCREIRSNFETYYGRNGFDRETVYPGSREYSKMWTAPTEVRPDWAAVVQEARNVFEPLLAALHTTEDTA